MNVHSGDMRSLEQGLLPRAPVSRHQPDDDNLGFDAGLVTMRARKRDGSVMDALGHGEDEAREVGVDELKGRFFIIGLQTGFTLNLFAMSILLMASAYSERTGAIFELSKVYYPLFRMLFLFCFFFCCHGVTLFVWKRFGVDYRAILGVSHSHNYHAVVRFAFGLMCLNFSCFTLYVLTLNSRLTPNKHLWPAAALGGSALALLWPFDFMPEWADCAQRYKLLRRLGKVMASPLSRVTFAHTFIADVLCSMPKLFGDALMTGCVYATGSAFTVQWDRTRQSLTGLRGLEACSDRAPHFAAARLVLSVLPFWLRLMQCCRAWWDGGGMGGAARQPRHAFNAAKYCTSIAVVVLSFVDGVDARRAWVVASVASTLYALAWDVYMDWGYPPLLDLIERPAREAASFRMAWQRGGAGSPTPPSLPSHRDGRRYPRWAYHVAVGTNALARMGWAILISPGQQVVQQHVVLVLGCVELLRRAQWALLRLEWEQWQRERATAEAAEREAADLAQREAARAMALHRKPGII